MADKTDGILDRVGKVQQPQLADFFSEIVSGSPPDTSKWYLVEDNDASVTVNVWTDETIQLLNVAGTGAADNAIARTTNLIVFGKKHKNPEDETTEVELTVRFLIKCADNTGEYAVGLASAISVPTADQYDSGTIHAAGLHCDNDTVRTVTDDGTTLEATDVSAQVTQAAYHLIKIVLTSTDTKFYIDGTLRATHSTRVPLGSFFFMNATKNTNGVTTSLKMPFVIIDSKY